MLGGVIAARLAEWGDIDLPLERAVFGTADPEALAAAVDEWCRAHLGAGVARYHFFESSSGSVHGVALEDGRDVVVKVHRPALTLPFLTSVLDAQRAMVEHGIAGAVPLAGPVSYGPAHITAESMLPSVPRADGHEPSVRRAIANGLADFVRVGQELGFDRRQDLAPPMVFTDGARLYPEPHSPRFDFEATASGAEWIDAIMARVHETRAALGPAARTFVHGDWRIENVEVAAGRVVAIYDWDSVCVEPEVHAVANAARTFSVDWSRPNGEHFPADAAIADFVDEYETARGTPFAAHERSHLAVEIVAGAAYGARCEHAIAWPEGNDTQQAQLRRLGAPLLEHGLAALG